MLRFPRIRGSRSVAPRAGAWIEITSAYFALSLMESLPVRERGLKLPLCVSDLAVALVAPRAGAWIEM